MILHAHRFGDSVPIAPRRGRINRSQCDYEGAMRRSQTQPCKFTRNQRGFTHLKTAAAIGVVLVVSSIFAFIAPPTGHDSTVASKGAIEPHHSRGADGGDTTVRSPDIDNNVSCKILSSSFLAPSSTGVRSDPTYPHDGIARADCILAAIINSNSSDSTGGETIRGYLESSTLANDFADTNA